MKEAGPSVIEKPINGSVHLDFDLEDEDDDMMIDNMILMVVHASSTTTTTYRTDILRSKKIGLRAREKLKALHVLGMLS
ncbi:hypothetical protein Tco_1347078 [Tanacetum coccineum]